MGDLSDGGVVFGLEPLDGVGLLDSVGGTDGGCASLAAGNTGTWAGTIEHNVCQRCMVYRISEVVRT